MSQSLSCEPSRRRFIAGVASACSAFWSSVQGQIDIVALLSGYAIADKILHHLKPTRVVAKKERLPSRPQRQEGSLLEGMDG